MSDSTQNAVSAASVAANIAQGNYIGAAISAVRSIFGGGGGTPAVAQGFEIRGNLTPAGFEGSVLGVGNNGARYTIDTNAMNTGEYRELKKQSADYWKELGLPDNITAVPFNINSPDIYFVDSIHRMRAALETLKKELEKAKTAAETKASNVANFISGVSGGGGGGGESINFTSGGGIWFLIAGSVAALIYVIIKR